jgi:hypothetical protein
MGFLVPLYLAGLAALSLPLIFHLVRRTPKGRQDFSSLMFLAPTPPRLTRRSRLDQILLLALRLGALALLAMAFARPFLREAAALSLDGLPGRRVALVLDTSASMRRADLWRDALRRIQRELDDLGPADDVALYTFDDRLSQVVGFEQEDRAHLTGKPKMVGTRLRTLEPGWGATDLGAALVAVAGEMDATGDARQSRLEPQMIVVSDFQKGSRIDALEAFEWPKRVPVVFRPVAPMQRGNASVRLVVDNEGTGDPSSMRVRVVNAADSTGDQFYVSFASAALAGTGGSDVAGTRPKQSPRPDEVAVYVPAGQSRVVKLPMSDQALTAERIVLRGDDHEFDNSYFVVPSRKQRAVILYAGSDAPADPRGLLYYLRLAVANDPWREVDVQSRDAMAAPPELAEPAPRLTIVSQSIPAAWQAALREWIEAGGFLLLVPANEAAARSLPPFFDDVELAEGGADRQDDYRLLGDIDFLHPLFSPFANPRYSDFTKIHFWNHRRLSIRQPASSHVIARFDNGDPAVLERALGRGRVMVLASGWHPDDSQLALSSKFVPLIGGLLDQACGFAENTAGFTVHAAVPLSERPEGAAAMLRTPSGREIPLAAEARTFLETDEPGLYLVKSDEAETPLAVNLAVAESDTAPLDLEQLEQRGVRVGRALSRSERMDRVRQQRDIELEDRQRVWRWLIAGVVGLLLLETWLAGRAERKIA